MTAHLFAQMNSLVLIHGAKSFDRLPAELLSEIFVWWRDIELPVPGPQTSTRTRVVSSILCLEWEITRPAGITASLVCSRWRDIAQQTPRLWSWIDLRWTTQIIEMSLEMSKTSLLHLHFYADINDLQPTENDLQSLTLRLDIAARHACRTHTLIFIFDGYMDLSSWYHYLKRPFPVLESLYISYPYRQLPPFQDVSFMEEDYPRLKSLRLDRPFRPELIMPMSSLLVIKISVRVGVSEFKARLCDALRGCPQLLHLYLKTAELPVSSPVRLDKLQYLELVEWTDRARVTYWHDAFFENVTFPASTRLMVEMINPPSPLPHSQPPPFERLISGVRCMTIAWDSASDAALSLRGESGLGDKLVMKFAISSNDFWPTVLNSCSDPRFRGTKQLNIVDRPETVNGPSYPWEALDQVFPNLRYIHCRRVPVEPLYEAVEFGSVFRCLDTLSLSQVYVDCKQLSVFLEGRRIEGYPIVTLRLDKVTTICDTDLARLSSQVGTLLLGTRHFLSRGQGW
ncbi:hypothetical protein SISSUDRAFT_1130547 [Sistotremastrum suecicum HHB10207 ss-3]|uniref:Uncharacterized protein n=1 Tax=Sistotremastrum suecicum HHB10207 ss-3 TaxID=1314776 RepID=A0A166BBR7_9AGAM|nr:hypothetical protein SISSUDRAFT_1130547 [Sistotremastrum suecicum HHB10207 ss-3]